VPNQIQSIIIVGGGTAGWSTAAALATNKNLSVTLIESSTIPTIGVGESTIPQINLFHNHTKFDIFKNLDWLASVDGLIKLTIDFNNFVNNKNDDKWIHPFFDFLDRDRMTDTFMNNTDKNEVEYVTSELAFGRLHKAGFINNTRWSKMSCCGKAGAYQIDAGLYSALLKQETMKATSITVLDAVVTEVVLSPDQNVQSLILDNGVILTADLYVDCSGFNSVLIDKVDSPWEEITSRLLVDSAVVAQLPYLDKTKQQSNSTNCHALSSGWVWNIPLESRVGSGYIYSSQYTSTEDAIEEFRQHLHDQYGYTKETINIRKQLNFKTGYRPAPWKNNVVAIGMSAFFAEPIESTAIASFQAAAMQLNELIKAPHISMVNKMKVYNEYNSGCVLGLFEFAEAHYTLTHRTDTPFWKYYNERPYSDELRQILDLYSNPDPTVKFDDEGIRKILGYYAIFTYPSWQLMFLGYGHLPKSGVAPTK
jgi:tryptophan halogenase